MSLSRMYAAVRLSHEGDIHKDELFSRNVPDDYSESEKEQFMKKEANNFFLETGFTVSEMKIINEKQFLTVFLHKYPPFHVIKKGVFPLYANVTVTYENNVIAHFSVRMLIDNNATDFDVSSARKNIERQCLNKISKQAPDLDMESVETALEWCSELDFLKLQNEKSEEL